MRMRTKKWARPELSVCPYYIQTPAEYRSRWADTFTPARPMHLELGCGKGYYLEQVALACPDTNFIGIDLSDDVLGVARRRISEAYENAGREVDNIILTWQNIERIDLIFAPEDKFERIYINFCNPWFKPGQHKKRLTHPRQLAQYRTFLTDNGEIWFKTDDDELFLHSMKYFDECGFKILYQTDDLHASGFLPNFMTEHEIMYTAQGIKIKFVRVSV